MSLKTDRLRDAIYKSGMTQRELARKLGVTSASISRYLSGVREPRSSVLLRMSAVLNVSPEYLTGWVPDMSEISYCYVFNRVSEGCQAWSSQQKKDMIKVLLDAM